MQNLKRKLTIISASKNKGGANIAASRIKNNLKKNFQIQSVYSNKNNIYFKLKYFLARLLVKFFANDKSLLNSLNIFTTLNLNDINGDVIIVNWIGEETISLNDLIKLNKPIIWIAHDLWLCTSTEHFLKNPFKKSYTKKDTAKNFLKRIIFKQKKAFLNQKIMIVCNSNWMKNFFQESDLTKNQIIKKIYNPIETNFWKKQNKVKSKKKLKLDFKKRYILIGAHGGLKNYRKGGDLLIESLKYLKHLNHYVEFIVLGDNDDYVKTMNSFVFNFKKFTLDKKQQVLYHSAADFTIIPSRAESLPQFAVETILCKNPILTFNIAGMNEIVKHKFNGYLAKPFDKRDLAKGINFCLEYKNNTELSKARKKISKMFDKKNNLKEYSKLIKNCIKS